ncbi:MAG: N-acetyltransferase [Chloroflexi bacterium]|nr:N-acetyltransferase [Chloroflexota bacterium]MCY3696225.1 N-acetyltransferase [Chloroflexota bacterium]MXX32321.1 N-acetyltransferase [Chloroflexota bacterium]MXX79907.1 N-acetyltransferase [Chloroflexota bacterium]MYB23265.1 N-acetyltransferase [Chloroflexota bacterium]
MTTRVRIRSVGFGREATPFIDVLWRVYADDPHWIPMLRRVQRERLDPAHTPFLRYGQAQLFLAERDGEPVGRISAQINPLHDEKWNEAAGFFGHFDCVDDLEAAAALFEAAESWLRERGAAISRGPFSFTINDESGCLVEGFDSPPMVAMPHGRPWFPELIEANGYRKVKDLWAYHYPVDAPLGDRRQRAWQRIHEHPRVTVRPFDKRNFQRDVRIAAEIFNEAWVENWSSVPITEEEADRLASDLVQFADPDLTAFVEIDGDPAAMVISIPNLNECARDIDGRLFPFGWAKLLWRLRRRPESGRVMLLGVRQKWRTREFAQLGVMLTAEVHVRGAAKGYRWAELGWVLEDNHLLNHALRRTDAEVYKVYRVYEKAL